MALCHFGKKARKHWKAAHEKHLATEAALAKERKTRKQLQSEQVEMQDKVHALKKVEARLKNWEERKPMINHYMNAFCEVTK